MGWAVNCGLFAITLLANAKDPSLTNFNQDAMWFHILHCITNSIVKPFPKVKVQMQSSERRESSINAAFHNCSMPGGYGIHSRCLKCGQWCLS